MTDVQLALISKEDVSISPLLQQKVFVFSVPAKYEYIYSSEAFPLSNGPEISVSLDINLKTKLLRIYFDSTSEIPETHQYEFEFYEYSPYNKTNKFMLMHPFASICVKNILTNMYYDVEHFANMMMTPKNSSDQFMFCMKVCRKDVFALRKNPEELLTNEITDCSLLFEKNDLANFVINVQDVKFRVHKEILAAKSSVFLAMFNSKMKESVENQMTIEDFKAEVIHEFLRYIYTNDVPKLNLHAQDLLIVAEKYNVPKLMSVCIYELTRSLTVDNALPLLQTADYYNISELKANIMEYAKRNIKLIVKTDEYKTFKTSKHVYLLAEILEAVV